jgi:hypothetical protein
MESTKSVKKLKFNILNINSLIFSKRKKVSKIKKDEKRFNFILLGKSKRKKKENKIEAGAQKSALTNIATRLVAKPKSMIDKFKEVFGVIILGVLANNLPTLLKGLQTAFTTIKKFFEDNPWLGPAIATVFDIVVKGMKGILDLTKVLLPIIGGSFQAGLDTIRAAGKLIDETDKMLKGLDFDIFNLIKNPDEDDKIKQDLAEIEGKYYSSTTKKVYGSYSEALKDPAVKAAAIKPVKVKAQQKIKASAPGYDSNAGTTLLTDKSKVIMAPFQGKMGTMSPGDKTGTATTAPESWGEINDDKEWDANVERYEAQRAYNDMQKLSTGGTVTGQKMTVSGGLTGKAKRAITSVNYFSKLKTNTEESSNISKEYGENNSLFKTFMQSYKSLLKLKYPREGRIPGSLPSDYKATEQDMRDEETLWNKKKTIISQDATKEPGYDITGPNPNMVALFDGEVIPGGVGRQYNRNATGGDGRKGSGYGNHVIIRSEDPNNPGTYFDALYAHFPAGAMKVKDGDTITAGQVLGRKATAAEFADPNTREQVGSGSGPHQSVDFFKEGGPYTTASGGYPGWKQLRPLVTTQLLGGGGPGPNQLKQGDIIATNAKTTYYDPSLGGINASGYKTPDGLPATSSGEGYRPELFTAAAFPEFLAKLPKSMTYRADPRYMPGGRTLGKPFNVIVTNTRTNKTAVVRVNDVGSGVPGHSKNHMLDFSVATKDYLGIGDGNYTIKMGSSTMKPGPYKLEPPKPKTNLQISENIKKMILSIGKGNNMIFGQENINVEIDSSGKLIIKDTRGAFGTGLFPTEYETTNEKNKKLLLKIEKLLEQRIKNNQQIRPQQGISPATPGYGGGGNLSSITILKETTVAVVSGPTEIVEVPVQQVVPFVITPKSGSGLRNRSLIS